MGKSILLTKNPKKSTALSVPVLPIDAEGRDFMNFLTGIMKN